MSHEFGRTEIERFSNCPLSGSFLISLRVQDRKEYLSAPPLDLSSRLESSLARAAAWCAQFERHQASQNGRGARALGLHEFFSRRGKQGSLVQVFENI
ncbi:hypothetical protein [Bradyrhizobium neotropicale]|uniref:hypothetical protein n=1 Tax=Bradyrhizobium neotropicale TaxID=1497615 RepID=UPI001AD64F28|nr:hypothetical protein [Bradyrhizobium neotropicale]MBO4223488.1 hypothetical protein [Bradyrhizobium neotropicale]